MVIHIGGCVCFYRSFSLFLFLNIVGQRYLGSLHIWNVKITKETPISNEKYKLYCYSIWGGTLAQWLALPPQFTSRLEPFRVELAHIPSPNPETCRSGDLEVGLPVGVNVSVLCLSFFVSICTVKKGRVLKSRNFFCSLSIRRWARQFRTDGTSRRNLVRE